LPPGWLAPGATGRCEALALVAGLTVPWAVADAAGASAFGAAF
jgi:hypothetical protein